MVKMMNNETIQFVWNRCGTPCNDMEVPIKVEKWLEKEGLGQEEEGYLVYYQGRFGFLYVEDYTHDQQEDKDEKAFAMKHGLSSENVLNQLKKNAKVLSYEIQNRQLPVDVMVGEGTGFLGRHELALFFPFGVEKMTYNEIKNLLKTL